MAWRSRLNQFAKSATADGTYPLAKQSATEFFYISGNDSCDD